MELESQLHSLKKYSLYSNACTPGKSTPEQVLASQFVKNQLK